MLKMELPLPAEPLVAKAGTITVTCNNVIGPNGQILQQAVNIHAEGFPADTADGQFAVAQWLQDAAKMMFANAFALQKQGSEQSRILQVAPGSKIL